MQYSKYSLQYSSVYIPTSVCPTQAEDLHTLLETVKRWGHALYPDTSFEDLVTQLEEMGDHTVVQVSCLTRLGPDIVYKELCIFYCNLLLHMLEL